MAMTREPASWVFSAFLGDAQSTLKCAARLARELEERFIVDGWPVGRNYGSELQLGQQYGAGRVVVREAARILEARGTARRRCGRRGGLEVTLPSLEELHGRVAEFCLLSNVSRDQLQTVQEVLRRASARMAGETRGPHGNPVIAFYADCAERLHRLDSMGARDGARRSFAQQIVDDLMKTVGPLRWTDGYFLGNQVQLCERYAVDHRALRQAIRILESAEAAVSLPGRGRGLMACSPKPASIGRLICCYFAATRIHHHQAWQAFKWISVEAMALAAQSGSAESIEPIKTTLAALHARADTAPLSELVAIEQRQLALSGNPLLDLFLRSANSYPFWSPFGAVPTLPGALRDMLECVAAVNDALVAGDATAAAMAQERKFAVILRNLQTLVPEREHAFSA